MSGTLSRTKGHSFERDIAIDFQELGWTDARRQLEYHIKDALGVDLQGTEPFAVQCKRGRQYAPITAIEEIMQRVWIHDSGGVIKIETVPLLITKADRKPTMAVLPWVELKKLLKMAYPKKP